MKSKAKENQMGDFIINGKLTIEMLYELAKSKGLESSELFFSIKHKGGAKRWVGTDHIVDFGSGWTKDSVIVHLLDEDEDHVHDVKNG